MLRLPVGRLVTRTHDLFIRSEPELRLSGAGTIGIGIRLDRSGKASRSGVGNVLRSQFDKVVMTRHGRRQAAGIIVALLVGVGLLGTLAHQYAGVDKGLASATTLSDLRSLEDLKVAFNRDQGMARLVLVMSPT